MRPPFLGPPSRLIGWGGRQLVQTQHVAGDQGRDVVVQHCDGFIEGLPRTLLVIILVLLVWATADETRSDATIETSLQCGDEFCLRVTCSPARFRPSQPSPPRWSTCARTTRRPIRNRSPVPAAKKPKSAHLQRKRGASGDGGNRTHVRNRVRVASTSVAGPLISSSTRLAGGVVGDQPP